VVTEGSSPTSSTAICRWWYARISARPSCGFGFWSTTGKFPATHMLRERVQSFGRRPGWSPRERKGLEALLRSWFCAYNAVLSVLFAPSYLGSFSLCRSKPWSLREISISLAFGFLFLK
jgi:hypothetical protein